MIRVLAAALLGFGAVVPASSGNLGEVSFPISCSVRAQEQFNKAIALLHSFQYPLTVRAFEEVVRAEPNCAMAHWGVAISQRPNPLAGPFSPELLEKGRVAIDQARRAQQQTAHERRWIEALGQFFDNHDRLDQPIRSRKYELAMAQLHADFPADGEAAIFYALALNEAVDLSDLTYAKQLKAAAILEKMEGDYPNHPGIPHYLVHSYDYPALAERALSAAFRCTLAPASPHALHMPSHIFALRGMWNDVIESDLAADAAIVAYSASAGSRTPPAALPGRYHSLDFIITARLQLAQDREAKKIVDLRNSLTEFPAAFRYTGHTAYAAIPVRYAFERGAWAEAAALEVPRTPYPQAEAVTWFGKALGSARSRRLPEAKKAIEKIRSLQAELTKRRETYWSNQAHIMVLAAEAWVALNESRTKEAIGAMTTAAAMEDKTGKHIAMENRLSPMRELLGELLLEAGEPSMAIGEFNRSLAFNPNRVRSLAGLAAASIKVGNNAQAQRYYERLIELTGKADTDRVEIQIARRFLASAR